ncbi:hypothetical protein Gotri_017570 [Gossypium trilobum]|uniref:Uncharacterized protein n=1 Tax=Gossypium trilobum TaxID=34281 RepID=A0A7J9E730_9ROSI|nr:hypothetical protein [Gossypium trilobum]
MAEKMPSFKCGGAYWFTDLTTPDSLYLFPVLTALTFFITVEASGNMQEGMEGNPAAATMKNVSRVLALLTVPFTMNFPKAPRVKKALGIPEIPDQPAATASRPSIDLYSALKQTLQQARTAAEESASVSAAPTKVLNRSTPSLAVNQRIKHLEKQVKGKKKNKKR